MATAIIRNINPNTAIATCIFHVHRIQRGYDTTVNDKPMSNKAFVGNTMLEKPSPKSKAKTAVCRVNPTRSARGAMMGITRKAFAEAEEMKKFKPNVSR